MGVSLTKCLELSLACSKAFRRSWLQWSFFFFLDYIWLLAKGRWRSKLGGETKASTFLWVVCLCLA